MKHYDFLVVCTDIDGIVDVWYSAESLAKAEEAAYGIDTDEAKYIAICHVLDRWKNEQARKET